MQFNKSDLKSKDKVFQSLDEGGKIISVSDGWLKKLGYAREEVVGKFFGSFLDDKSLLQVKKNFPHLKDYGFVNNVPLVVKMKNGILTEAVLNGISEYDGQGRFENTICEIRDVHDILHSEQEVKKMLERERLLRNFSNLEANILQMMHHEDDLKLFLNHIIHILVEPIDIKAVYIANEKTMYGYPNATATEVISSLSPLLKDESFFFEIKESSSSENLLQLMQKADVFGFAGKAISLKDHNIYILFFLNKIELKDEWRDALKEIVSLLDYTVKSIINKEEKEALTKQLHLKEEMMLTQSKQAAMGDMIAMIAHQWRQPLAVMGMTVNNLIISVELKEEISTDYLLTLANDLSIEIQQLSKTIDDFRNFFKPNQQNEKITIEDVLNNTLDIIATSLANNNISLNIQNTSKSSLFINKSSLMQVLLNIIGNAKEILLEKEVSEAAININIAEIKEAITISICDNGGGIPEAIMNKIGNPYYTTKEALNGTGLGLYISRTIVEKHLFGTLTWHNEDKGACFVITLNIKNSVL